jgi:tripartite-type tricarboxylate transporter receptor subunit TctC
LIRRAQGTIIMVLPLERPPMRFSRRGFLRLPVGAAAFRASARVAMARGYPDRPVRIIVGFPPGGVGDILARLIAQWLSVQLDQAFIIENRPGAAGNIGAEAAARAPADGYTLLQIGLPPHAIGTEVYPKLNFDILRDIAPVASIIRAPTLLEVNPLVPATTVPEFIAYATAHPGRISMASNGTGSGPHIYGELFKMMADVKLTHVPYRGSGPALTDLLGGQVQMMFDNVPSSIEHVRAGRLRALAVTSATRWDGLPGLPAVAEFVPGYEASSWYGFGAPKNTPADIIDTLNSTINGALADPTMKRKLTELGGDVLPLSPAETGKVIASETEKWLKVVRFAGIKAE